jgi:non-heme chloroperoxidase
MLDGWREAKPPVCNRSHDNLLVGWRAFSTLPDSFLSRMSPVVPCQLKSIRYVAGHAKDPLHNLAWRRRSAMTIPQITQGSGWRMAIVTPLGKWIAGIVAGLTILVVAGLAGAIVFGTAGSPKPMQPRPLDLTNLPALSHYTARDGTKLVYRAYPGGGEQVAVLIHGTATDSSVMNALAKTLNAVGTTVYAPDLRGHGASGKRGDIDYIGQLDDDLADLIAAIRPEHANAALTLIGFSGGGAFTIRIAGGPYGDLFNRYIVIDPAIVYPSSLARPNAGGWATPYLPRIVGLIVLNKLGIHWFDGLDAIVFAIPPGNENLTGVYSFRLAMNLNSRDYFGSLQRTKKPMALIAGGDDDQFYADRYAPTLQPAKPDLTVELVPGLDHVDMLMKPAALAALRRTFETMPR